MVLLGPLENMLMGTIAERSICRHLTVAKFVVASFADVESDRSKTSQDPLALAIAEGANLRVTA